MEKIMILDDRAKTRLGLICFLPVLCFGICFLYFLMLVMPLTHGHPVPGSINTITINNYNTLFTMLASSAIITAPVFIYCLVLLTRLKTVNASHKLLWFIFLCVMAPIASAVFWMTHIRNAEKYVPVHGDIEEAKG